MKTEKIISYLFNSLYNLYLNKINLTLHAFFHLPEMKLKNNQKSSLETSYVDEKNLYMKNYIYIYTYIYVYIEIDQLDSQHINFKTFY